MWNNFRKSMREMDKDRMLEMMGLEARRNAAQRYIPFFALFGVGMLLGVGLGVMVAPKAGRELRSDLKEKLEQSIPRAQEMISSAVEENMPRPSAPHS